MCFLPFPPSVPLISLVHKGNCVILVDNLKFWCLKMASNLVKQIWVCQWGRMVS